MIFRFRTARGLVVGVGLGLLISATGCGPESRATNARSASAAQDTIQWNFVFILADDMGWNQTGYGWNQAGYPGVGFYETPNVDRIAAEGMVFTDAYASASICSPTRAGLMTGKHPARLHITDYIPGAPYPYARLTTPEMAMSLPLEEITIPEMLEEKGYVSGHFGKWHLNVDKEYQPGRPGDPASQGFDDILTTVKPEPDADPFADPHHVEAITERSLRFLEQNQNRPFFLYVAHHVVHRPLHAPPEQIAEYEKKPGARIMPEFNPVMGAMIENMDQGIGRILEKIEELGLAERTIVIFTADNGGLELLQDQEPLRGGKAMLWEGGIRIPLAVRWPSVIEPGSVSEVPVISHDWFPTIAEIAGIEPGVKPLDGISLVPVLRGTGTLERETLYWHYPHYHHLGYKPSGAIREGEYKLTEWYEESLTGADHAVTLHRLDADIGETNDLADEMPEKAADLKAKLDRWRERIGAQEMVVNPNYDPERAHWRFENHPSEETPAAAR
ncbi:MAG: sulfatase [Gemmatimonadota bacterium]